MILLCTNFVFLFLVLRLGRNVEMINGTLKTLHLSDQILRITTTVSRIYQCLFLAANHLIFLARVGFLNLDTDKLADLCNKFWIGSIICNLTRDFYEISKILKKWRQTTGSNLNVTKKGQNTVVKHVSLFVENYPEVFWDTLKNLCDAFIPLTAMGKLKLNPGIIGLLGSVSSIAGLIALIDPKAKLLPA